MKKRILIFSLAYYPSYVSGAETAIKDTTDRINDIDFELITHWFDKTQPKTEKIGNVLVHRVGLGNAYFSKIFFIPMAALTARKLHKENPYDGMWAMMTYMLFPLVLARFLGLKVRYALSLQDGDSYETVFKRLRILPVRFLLDYGFKHATVIQAISKYLATWPAKRGYTGPVELIYDGANPKSIHPNYPKEEVQKLRATFVSSPDDIILMNTARLVPQKGADVTIRAMQLLPKQVKLVLVGDGAERKKLEELVDELNVRERVMFTGQVDREVVSMYRLAADIFVGPSRSEGLGHAFLSAMACRLPVVTTQVGGIADFLFDAERNPDQETTGWAVDPDNPEQIAEAVRDIMTHPEKVERVIQTARTMVEEKYDWDAIAIDMRERVFARLLKEKQHV
jgi:glycosyltransferase involved in cell wall biosynthesis